MAHTKAKGTSKLGRDSQSKRLGVKIFGDQYATAGAVILRQRGLRVRPGEGVGKGKDDTLFAVRDGVVKFDERKVRLLGGRVSGTRRFVAVKPPTK